MVYYNIKGTFVGRDNIRWLTESHGDLCFTRNKKRALYFTDSSIKSPLLIDFLDKCIYETVVADDIPEDDWQYYSEENE